jgi:hypothetical protein
MLTWIFIGIGSLLALVILFLCRHKIFTKK